uniref:Glycylpeptide N-tetradecanoyltransferase n=1 Tax=Oncorhynchus tshawytscha TaxID=74940 RepID=A0A8C8FAC7_ONCTS
MNETRRLQDIQRAMELLSCQGAAKSIDEATKHKYQFWDTQPVPKLNEVVTSHGPMEADKDNIRQEPYSLPQGFMWDTLDLSNADVLKELYTLLNENYVEDDDNMFRFDYSPSFLKWALRPPGWLPQWHCGVRVSSNKKLVGFISAIPADIHIYDTLKKMVEINFLCVHKKLRSKRVAPVLIREITRRVNLEGIFQAVYTAGVVLPKPVSTCRYWHRSLNPRKLVEVKFSHLSRNMTLQRTMKLYRLPDSTKTPGLRAMERRDVRQVTELLQKHMRRFQLAPSMGEEEVAHWFLPQDDIIDTFVVEGAGGVLTDFTSFYTLPSTVMHHPQHRSLKAAYSFYSVHTHTPLLDLMNDTLILAKLKGFDVFNALDLMENKVFLEKLKFGIGDGNLQYYLFNWKCPPMDPDMVRRLCLYVVCSVTIPPMSVKPASSSINKGIGLEYQAAPCV